MKVLLTGGAGRARQPIEKDIPEYISCSFIVSEVGVYYPPAIGHPLIDYGDGPLLGTLSVGAFKEPDRADDS